MAADTIDDPKATTAYRALKAVVIILGVLIILAMGALVVGAAMKLKGHHGEGCVGYCGTAELPQGAKIVSTLVTGNRLIIVFQDSRGDGVEIVDAETGKHVALIRTAEHGLPK